jgi:hypothetical protein
MASASIKEVIIRFEICKLCEQSVEVGHSCKLYEKRTGKTGCCTGFGRWRAQLENDCQEGKWPKVNEIKT